MVKGNGKKRVPKKILKRIVWKRDKGKCQLCGIKLRANEDWDLSRRTAGGPYTVGNCFVAHHSCNTSQGTKTPSQVKKSLGLKPTKKSTKLIHKKKLKNKKKREKDVWTVGEIFEQNRKDLKKLQHGW